MHDAERPLRLAEFDDLYTSAVRRVERHGTNIRMHVAGAAGVSEQVRDLTARETQCCSFFSFAITGTDDDLTLDIAVPPARRDILEALAERASEQSADQ